MTLTESQVQLARHMTEAELQVSVIELAQRLGWLVHAERPARTKDGWRTPIQGDRGFPDLVLARYPALIFAEIKTERGRLTVEQGRWQQQLITRCAVWDGKKPKIWVMGSYLWRPRDWFSGEIERVLR